MELNIETIGTMAVYTLALVAIFIVAIKANTEGADA